MGKLIKNHWARLIVLTASICTSPSYPPFPILYSKPSLTPLSDQVAAAVEGFFWPKIFWDFLTKNLDAAVKPFPVLQIINLVFGIVMFCWEWPLGFLAGSGMHRSIEARLVILPMAALAAALMYQTTNPALYYTIALGIYFWAYSEGEVSYYLMGVWKSANVFDRLWLKLLGPCPNEPEPGKYRSSVRCGSILELVLEVHIWILDLKHASATALIAEVVVNDYDLIDHRGGGMVLWWSEASLRTVYCQLLGQSMSSDYFLFL